MAASDTFSSSVVHKTYELYLLFYRYSVYLPKKDRFAAGLRAEQALLDALEFSYSAQIAPARETRDLLVQADRKLKIAQLLIRVLYEVGALDKRKYLELSERLVELGKMVGGWIKYTTQHLS